MTTTTERATRPPTDRIMRVSPFAVRAAADMGTEGDGLTLDGFAAVFNRLTVIDSWEGRFNEQLLPGSMRKTFRETVPKLQFDHGRHPMVGSIPIGTVRTAEEATDPVLAPEGGAHVIARLFDNWLTAPVRDAIADQAIDGMSFRFSVVREQWKDRDGKVIRDEAELERLLMESWLSDAPDEELLTRSLQEVKVRELGPVVWPAYEDTSVSLRNRVTIDLGAIRAGDVDERRKLANALFAADAVSEDNELRDNESREGNISTGQDAPEPTAEAAEDHVDQPTGTPGPTVESAGDHESSTRGTRPIDLWVLHARQTVRGCS